MDDCIFCKIVAGDIPCDTVYEDEDVMAFKDINPKAPVHVLIIPKEHVESAAHLGDQQVELAGRLQLAAVEVARRTGVLEDGFRLVTNSGAGAGQAVFHLHYHLLAGREFTWPPG